MSESTLTSPYRESKKTIETLSFPAASVLEFYTRLDEIDAKRQSGNGNAKEQYEFAKFVQDTVPYLRGLEYDIDIEHAMHPMIEVKGKFTKPADGVDGVLFAKEIPEERVYEFLEKCDRLNCGGRVGRYEFWKFMEELFGIDTTLGWRIQASPGFHGVILMAKDEILRRAKREVQAYA